MLLVLLAAAATLSGRVLDEDGAGIEGLTVVVYDARLNYATATTRNGGDWSIEGLPGRTYRLRAYAGGGTAWPDRFYPSEWDYCAGTVVVVGEDDTVGDLDITLPVGGILTGRVFDRAGAPLAGVEVTAFGTSQRTALSVRTGYSDDEGRFSVTGLDSEPGASELFACKVQLAGWPDQYFGETYATDMARVFSVALGEPTGAGDQALLDGISVTGTVYGPDGPVASGTVFVYASSQVLSTSIRTDGTYLGDGLPPGDVIAWAESPGLATTYYPDADRPSGDVPVPDEGTAAEGVDLDLPTESTLTVQFAGDGEVAEVAVMLYNSERTVGRGGGLDEAGAITIDALHPGAYTLYVYGADGGFTDDWVRDGREVRTIDVDGEVTLTVDLERGASIAGTVTDETGAPVYGAYVYATPGDVDSDASAVATAADGTYEILGLLAGDFVLRASYTWYCPTDPGYVTEYWEGALVEEDANYLVVPAAEALTGQDFVLWLDADHDQMGDTWESENGLDPTRDDAAEDPDGDGFLNYDEWLLGSDPTDPSADKDCGCGGKAGAAALLVVPWLIRRRKGRA